MSEPQTHKLSLRETQSIFIRALAQLILYAHDKSYELTLGEGLRSDHKGHMPNSNHYIALAQDLNLFVKNVWQKKECDEWDDLGAYWKTLHPLARWGGDFMARDVYGHEYPIADLNHFSFEWEGVK